MLKESFKMKGAPSWSAGAPYVDKYYPNRIQNSKNDSLLRVYIQLTSDSCFLVKNDLFNGTLVPEPASSAVNHQLFFDGGGTLNYQGRYGSG